MLLEAKDIDCNLLDSEFNTNVDVYIKKETDTTLEQADFFFEPIKKDLRVYVSQDTIRRVALQIARYYVDTGRHATLAQVKFVLSVDLIGISEDATNFAKSFNEYVNVYLAIPCDLEPSGYRYIYSFTGEQNKKIINAFVSLLYTRFQIERPSNYDGIKNICYCIHKIVKFFADSQNTLYEYEYIVTKIQSIISKFYYSGVMFNDYELRLYSSTDTGVPIVFITRKIDF